MIKIEFKEAQTLNQHGLNQDCMFVFCWGVVKCSDRWSSILLDKASESNDLVEGAFILNSNIKLIRKANATEV